MTKRNKLKSDPGMYAKMRRQRRQKMRWAGSMLDNATRQPGYDERQARREAKQAKQIRSERTRRQIQTVRVDNDHLGGMQFARVETGRTELLYTNTATQEDIAATQAVYRRTRYEQGARDHQDGLPPSASLDRVARDGYNNSARDRSRLACSVIAARGNTTAKNVYRMRVRLCSRYLSESGIDYPLTDEAHIARVLRVIAGLETHHVLH